MPGIRPNRFFAPALVALGAIVAFGALVAPVGALDGAIFNVVEHRDIDYIAGEDHAENKDKLDLFDRVNAPPAS